MSHNAARHDPRGRSEAEEDAYPQARQPEHSPRPRRPATRPRDGGGIGPDGPGGDEFELIGDDDLGPADLGPADPDVTDPDADSGRIRKMT